MTITKAKRWSLGSRWIRIDPHIHAPGTLRRDEFNGDWQGYLSAINSAQPQARILGITDYCVMRSFRRVLDEWRKGKLPGVELLIANVELRLNIQAHKGSAVNVHLLFPWTDESNLSIFETKLAKLQFRYSPESFGCSEAELVRLGRAYTRNEKLEEEAALREGALQFKVSPDELAKLREEQWFRDNVLVAIPGNEDGLKGLAYEDAFHAQREELFRLLDIVFSANPKDRNFWIGKHKDFETRGYARKPCLHGSDAHKLGEVLRPAENRLCFIKATSTPDGLRQVLLDPERRVQIGPYSPEGPAAGDVIKSVRIGGAPWLKMQGIELNEGLVAIIGARGSGKTALADLIAFGGYALTANLPENSFVDRARDHLEGVVVELEWGNGEKTSSAFPTDLDHLESPRVQYLSQHFVETLCTTEGLAEPLLAEIERIVFEAISPEDRLEATAFSELRDVVVAQPRERRSEATERIASETFKIGEAIARHSKLPKRKEELAQLSRQQLTLKQQIASILVGGGEERKKLLEKASAKLEQLRVEIAKQELGVQRLGDVTQKVELLERTVRERFDEFKRDFGDVVPEAEWNTVTPSGFSEALALLRRRKQELELRCKQLREKGMEPDFLPIASLVEQITKLNRDLGLDAEAAKKRVLAEQQLRSVESQILKKKAEIIDAESAKERITVATAARLDAYVDCVSAMEAEVAALQTLYAPLRNRLEDPALAKLGFEVERRANVAQWVARGENLLDLRRKWPFPEGKNLTHVAEMHFGKIWRSGTSSEAKTAMLEFWETYRSDLPKLVSSGRTLQELGDWLFSLDHIEVRYSVRYDGLELSRLSPGTRGVVLLTLYLALDEWDRRPLVIDQPEENLDPRSIFSELVGFFRTAALRRQVIMVTHNANLVVNTDADQVVVATSERTTPAELPNISYEAGGLEERWVREDVCALLEGGREAFAARARRYPGVDRS